jgi:hypothetical protein
MKAMILSVALLSLTLARLRTKAGTARTTRATGSSWAPGSAGRSGSGWAGRTKG